MLLNKYLKEFKAESQTDICTPMFTIALLATDKRWKQPNCLSNGILFSFKREQDSCYNMDEFWEHYVKLNKPIAKRKILYDSTFEVSIE